MLVIEHRSDLLSSDQKLQEQLHRIDKNVVSYAPHTRSVNCLAWNALGSRLASCSADESFKVWDLETTTLTINSKRETFAQKTKTPLEQVCWSRTDPDVLFVSGAGDTLCVWDIRLKTIAKSFKCKGASLFMACSPDSNYVSLGNKQDWISVFDLRQDKATVQIQHKDQINEIAWSKNSDYLMLTTGTGELEIVQRDSLQAVHSFQAHSGSALSLKLSQDFETFASGGYDGTVSIWDSNHLCCLRSTSQYQEPVRSLSFDCSGSVLAVVTESPQISFISTATAESLHTIPVNMTFIHGLSWNPKHQVLAIGGEDRSRDRLGSVLLFRDTK